MLQLISIYWSFKNKTYIPGITFRDLDSKEIIKLPLSSSYKFNFKLTQEKYCVGYYLEGKLVECKFNNKVDNKFGSQCNYCENLNGFKSAFFFKEQPNERIKEHLSQQHYIYLAYFEPGIIKVGTAAQSRMEKRLIEQDALIHAFIARSSSDNELHGLSVQKLERDISKRFNITENVKHSHKVKYLTVHPNVEFAKNKIQSEFDKIKDFYFSTNSEFKNWFFDKIEIVNNSNLNEIYYPSTNAKIIVDNLNLFGTFLGIRGNYLILKNSNEYIFDSRFFEGRMVESYLEEYEYIEEQLSF